MSYPPDVTEADLRLLALIARGHPSRKITATHRGIAKQVSALTWDELQLVLGSKSENFSDSIACLVANKYIDSGSQLPSLWGRIRGAESTTFFWITEAGARFLEDNKIESGQDAKAAADRDQPGLKHSEGDLVRVEKIVEQLGYRISPYGIGVALLSLESGYSHAETASQIVLATLALDAKAASGDLLRSIAMAPHAKAIIEILSEYKRTGLMREEIFQNDARAVIGVVTVDQNQKQWIDSVLSDNIISQDRLAISSIDYKNLLSK